jgi:hypothetical protein
MKGIRNLAILNAVSFIIHLGLSFLTQLKVFNAKDVGEISDQYRSLFTPSGKTFLIWTVIYIALIGFCIYHLVKAYKSDLSDPANKDLQKMGSLFIINNLSTAAWIIFWVNDEIFFSIFLILVQLVTLIMMHMRLNIHNASRSIASKAFTQFPLSIYLGWISIATIANISTWLTSIGWHGWGVSRINWTITMIAIATFLTVSVINRKRNVFFGLVVLWAFYGILTRRATENPVEYEPVIMVTYGAMGIVAISCLFGLIRNLRRR